MDEDANDWRQQLLGIAATAMRHARDAARTIERAIDRDPIHVIGYRGYAAHDRALVLGRVLQDDGIEPPDPGHSRWRNFLHAIKRLESDPQPFAIVRAGIGESHRELVADDEGFLHEWIPLSSPLSGAGWIDATLELRHQEGGRVVRTSAPILAPPTAASFGVISDMDDTVLQSRVTNFLRAAKLLLLENARTRLPFPGVAAFYRALAAGAGARAANPIFYVSSSPWNLYDVIADFLEAQEIPQGPLLLRDWDLGALRRRHEDHKSRHIGEILGAFPTLPFILVGDSGQEDPEIYASAVRQHPGRILAIYIRNVTREAERIAAIGALANEVRGAGVPLVLADDTLAAARHAADHGWIPSSTLGEIGEEKRADEGAAGGKVDTPGVTDERAPTVVVEDGSITELPDPEAE